MQSDRSESEEACVEPLDWRVLYERYSGEMVRYLLKVTGDPEMARDLAQETFIHGMDRDNQLRDRARVRPWLYRIATNLALSHLRRHRLSTWFGARSEDAADRTDTIDRAMLTAEADHVRRALRAIPGPQAACLVLRERGFSRHEIAEICGIGEEAVKSRLARGASAFVTAYRRLETGA